MSTLEIMMDEAGGLASDELAVCRWHSSTLTPRAYRWGLGFINRARAILPGYPEPDLSYDDTGEVVSVFWLWCLIDYRWPKLDPRDCVKAHLEFAEKLYGVDR